MNKIKSIDVDLSETELWEYIARPLCHIKSTPYFYPVEIMRQSGNAGWEAFCIDDGYIYFKRPKSASQIREHVKTIAKNAYVTFAGLPSEFDKWFDETYPS
jgi:hypothetical protein